MNIFRKKPFILLAALVLTLACFGIGVSKPQAEEETKVKNVIFLIGDGMGIAAMTGHRYMSSEDTSSSLLKDTGFDPYLVGMQSTFPDDDEENVVDSAAAATAMASGVKTYNGAISVDKNKQPVETVLEWAKKIGKSTGVVSTSQINHATPASFAAHNESRSNYDEIADAMYDELIDGEHKVDVMLGGGTQYFVRDDRHIANLFKQDGYSYVTNREELLNDKSDKLLGLFAPVGLPMAIDRTEDIPSLAEMTEAAIERLNKNEEGFFLMVEGSQIDWAAHDNDIVGTMSEMKDFEKAFNAAIEFAKKDGETLVLATADHATGGLTIGSNGKYNWDQDVIKAVKRTPGFIAEQIVKSGDIKSALEEHINLELTEDEIQSVIDTKAKAEAKEEAKAKDVTADVAKAIKKIIDLRSNTGWTTGGHTGDDVPVYAFGPGKEKLAGKIDNTDTAKTIFEFFGKKVNEDE